jgi:hypothetical protein
MKARSANVEVGNHLSICVKAEENRETLCRGGQPQHLPDVYWHLASSPANKGKWERSDVCAAAT